MLDPILPALQSFVRRPFAWPGNYPQFAITSDGGVLCHGCVNDNYREILRAVRAHIRGGQCPPDSYGFQVEDIDVNWEDDALFCDHCNDRIESAYAEDQFDLK